MKCHYLVGYCSKNSGRRFETLLKLVYGILKDVHGNIAIFCSY